MTWDIRVLIRRANQLQYALLLTDNPARLVRLAGLHRRVWERIRLMGLADPAQTSAA
jgi:hypothetical protein